MPNPNRLIDKSHLSIDQAEERGFIHRDYVAHCFRWSHVVKFLMQRHRFKSEIIMDVGCGKDLPLPRLMYANKMTDFAYIGIDMNHLTMPEMLATAVKNGKADIQLLGGKDASKIKYEELEFEHPTVAVCFEVLEHVHPTICQALVQNVYALLADGGHAFFSTPVYNGSAAANHINEMGREVLASLFESIGFNIEANYGTFASQSEIEPAIFSSIHEDLADVWNELKAYYDSNVLSVIFAPIFPHKSRNNLWHLKKLTKPIPKEDQAYGDIAMIPKPWGQHPEVEKLFQ
jgi:2-polyprenyl-3-methyl-5-hydroxy-6-metoxy-1,4-benzoquinol methylase